MAKKIEVQIVGDADSFHKALGKATESTSRFGRVAGGVAKAGFLALGTAAVGAGVGIYKAVQAGSDWNETLNKSSVVFGKSAKGVDEWAGTMAEAGGISEQAALDAAGMFGTFGKAAGVGQRQLGKWSESLIQAASDLASFHNADPTQVLEDIRSGLAGEVEPLRKYGILLNDATLRQQALKMGLVDTTKNALTPNQRMLAAQALILQKLGPAAGDFARTSGGLANQQRILKAELENVVTELGAALLPIALKIAQVAFPLIIDVAHKVGSGLRGLVGWINHAAGHFEILGGKSTSVSGRIRNAWSRVVAFFKSEVMPIVVRLKGVYQDAMAAIAKTVQKHGDEVRRIMDRVGSALKAIAKVAIPILRYALTKVLPKAVGGAIRALDKITFVIQELVSWVMAAKSQVDSLGDALHSLTGINFNSSLLDILGIDPNKGLLTQVVGGGSSGATTRPVSTSGRTPVIRNVIVLDGKVIHDSVAQADKVYRRQNGRSAFA